MKTEHLLYIFIGTNWDPLGADSRNIKFYEILSMLSPANFLKLQASFKKPNKILNAI